MIFSVGSKCDDNVVGLKRFIQVPKQLMYVEQQNSTGHSKILEPITKIVLFSIISLWTSIVLNFHPKLRTSCFFIQKNLLYDDFEIAYLLYVIYLPRTYKFLQHE